MLSRIFRWIDARWPLSPFIRLALEEEMSGGSSYAYVFGSAVLILFLLQALTGSGSSSIMCRPSARDTTANYLRTEVPFGWLIHGLHYWGANVTVVCVLLHVSQVFIWGAYKRPHELQWVTGVFLFLLTMAMSLAGAALPWDKRSHWLVEVASSTAGTVPVIGELIKRIMLGGGVIGQLTLSRFFVLHAAVVSGVLFTTIAVHLVALRKVGNTGPWVKRDRRGRDYSGRIRSPKDGLVASLIILLLVALSVAALSQEQIGQLVAYLQSLKKETSATASVVPTPSTVAAAVPTGSQGEPGMAVTIIGSADHGGLLFGETCSSCHGPQGTGKVANPGSQEGIIPSLNPIDRDEFSPDPKAFTEEIDVYIQHGSRPEGPNPQFNMAPFGDTNYRT